MYILLIRVTESFVNKDVQTCRRVSLHSYLLTSLGVIHINNEIAENPMHTSSSPKN